MYCRSGLFSCPVIVSGQPRSDFFKIANRLPIPFNIHSLNIVYFMISSQAGLPYFSGSYFDSTRNKVKPKS